MNMIIYATLRIVIPDDQSPHDIIDNMRCAVMFDDVELRADIVGVSTFSKEGAN